MGLSAGEKVLELVELHRREASIYERRGQDDLAKAIRSIAADYERTVRGSQAEWLPIHQAQRAKGWSDRWWRERCQALEEEGLARKHAGRWEIHRTAYDRIRSKAGSQEEIDPSGDIRELAAQLAGD
jgi:hypothetical protein